MKPYLGLVLGWGGVEGGVILEVYDVVLQAQSQSFASRVLGQSGNSLPRAA